MDQVHNGVAYAIRCALPRWLLALLMLTTLGPPPAVAQDVVNGESLWRRCRACHKIGPGARNAVGPMLNDIIGRKAGTIEGYNYSRANRKAGAQGLVWTEEELFKYLKNPRSFMPGTKMAFAGLKDEADRRDLIAYLKQAAKAAGN